MNVFPRLTAVFMGGVVLGWMIAGPPVAGQQIRPTNPLRQHIKAGTDQGHVTGADTTDRPAPPPAFQPVSSPQQPSAPRTAARTGQVRQAAYNTAHRWHDYRSVQAISDDQSVLGESIMMPGGQLPPAGLPGPSIVIGEGKGVPGDFVFADNCYSCGGGGCRHCLIPCPAITLDNFELFAGVQGFTGPKNLGESGSFGFHEGFNWGAPVPCLGGALGMQIGLNAVHSSFSGASFTDKSRNQVFVTGGFFRRVDWGLQGGVVVDYLSDNWYTNTSLSQIRGEISWMFPCTHDLGIWFTSSSETDTREAVFTNDEPDILTWEPTDLFAFFYRHRFAGGQGATGRLFAGFSGDSDGLIGGDLRIPLSSCLAMETGFSYLVPNESKTGLPGGGHEQESWNVGVFFVWYPGLRSAYGNDYFRPLLNVANNGSFMVDLR